MAAVTVGSTPGQVNLSGMRGDRWGPFQFAAQTALDLSGRTWLAQIRADRDEVGEVIATIEVDDADAATGILRLTILPDQTALLVTANGKGKFYWDIQGTLDADATDVKTWFGGQINALGDVSVPA